MKKIICLLCALVLAVVLGVGTAEEVKSETEKFTSGDFKYIILEDGTVEIAEIVGRPTIVEIPAKIDEKLVTSIGDNAFLNCDSLTSISIPDSVTSIGEKSFAFCSSLNDIYIPGSVSTIGKGAFLRCLKLTATVERNSYAAEYFKSNNLSYTYPDSLDWLNN